MLLKVYVNTGFEVVLNLQTIAGNTHQATLKNTDFVNVEEEIDAKTPFFYRCYPTNVRLSLGRQTLVNVWSLPQHSKKGSRASHI